MQSLKMQPTFRLELPVGADQAIEKIRQAIKASELDGLVASAGRCVDFKIERSNQRFWSPHLSVQLQDADGGSELYGRFSPRPEIWTFIMAIYFGATFVIFCALIYAYAQWFLESSPWALSAIPGAISVIAALHLASMIGQQLSTDQMHLLRGRLDRALELAFPEPPAATATGPVPQPV